MADTESMRLLYVSLTRARDLLILPFPQNKTSGPWIDTLEAKWMVPEESKLELPSKTIIPTASREFEAPDMDDTIKSIDYQSNWFGPVRESTDRPHAVISPSAIPEESHAKVLEVREIFKPISLKGKPEMDKVGQAVHAVIAAEIIHPGSKSIEDIALRIIDNFDLLMYLDPGDAVACAKRFSAYIMERFHPTKVFAEHPVKHLLENGQLVSGWIDVLIQNKEGWIIIDHKSSSKPSHMLEKEALKYSGQLLAYKKGVETATKKKVLSSWIHFPLSGMTVRLST
jgi:ATP-dependent exoDNAse (exonuclease V) beta subunit